MDNKHEKNVEDILDEVFDKINTFAKAGDYAAIDEFLATAHVEPIEIAIAILTITKSTATFLKNREQYFLEVKNFLKKEAPLRRENLLSGLDYIQPDGLK